MRTLKPAIRYGYLVDYFRRPFNIPGLSMHLIEITARALIVKNEQIVLVKHKKLNVSFMPGGHVEFRETVEEALIREIKEELGLKAKVKDLWAIMENFFPQNGKDIHEISFIYKTDLLDLPSDQTIKSCEDQLTAFWAPLSDLEKHNHMPKQLISHLQNDLNKQEPLHLVYQN